MTLPDRDRSMVQFLARFGQAPSKIFHELFFPSLSSRTPCDRALNRLTERRYLARIERRQAGGSRGGSGQYVYQLGPRGHTLFRDGRYIPMRSVNYHTLAIVDAYMILHRLHVGGQLSIRGFSTEPDCWATIAGHELKPDLFIDIEQRDGRGQLKLWLEVDMGSEGQRQIKDKFRRYWLAHGQADAEEWPTFPGIVFVAVDEYRARELLWLLEQGPEEGRRLFRITTLEKFGEFFG